MIICRYRSPRSCAECNNSSADELIKSSRNSLGSSRLSSSHNSLSIPTTQKVDDSTFITQAVSHDTLSSNQISDLYNVPFDSDIYAVPIDVVKPPLKPKRAQLQRKRRRNTAWGYRDLEAKHYRMQVDKNRTLEFHRVSIIRIHLNKFVLDTANTSLIFIKIAVFFYGWYWGPISGETAEKILSNEPDGSFIVRDSSDDHYIFSLTFKLNNCVRHVRIEHDQGNFSFGSCTKFKSQTIVEFIENAVEHSRSGRYLFFLHRRPVIGPVRVQLLHPVSRFKQVQSLQHICRFVIHKNVRRDLIPSLPLPRRMIDYLNTPYYYTEHLVDVREVEEEQPESRALIDNQHNVQLVDNSIVPVNNYVIVNNTSSSTSNVTNARET
uniref:Uncharacterized protein LOC114342618 n=1 Tax=Diabrotica virgifera virgifera TaxID=50390 RepID=A0A6P7GHC8_DIAVI